MEKTKEQIVVEAAKLIGKVVRSFDFEQHDITGERACYIIGIVEGLWDEEPDCLRYKIRAIARVFAGAAVEVPPAKTELGAYFFPPLNGTPKFVGGVCNSVELA